MAITQSPPRALYFPKGNNPREPGYTFKGKGDSEKVLFYTLHLMTIIDYRSNISLKYHTIDEWK